MVSNQVVTVRLSVTPWVVTGLAVLLTAGCQSVPEPSAPVAAPAAVAISSPAAPATEQNAVDAALERDAMQPAAPAPAQAPVINANAPQTYVVKRGDTLWDISAMFLRDPWLWPEIWYVNPEVRNPHLIYPGDTLKLVYGSDGKPQIHLVTGNTVRVSPLVRSSPLDGPISTIPYEAIAAFLGKPSLLSAEEVEAAPKIAVVRDNHLVASLSDTVYVKGMAGHGPGRYSVVRVGDQLKDPETGLVLGYVGNFAASARIDQADDQLSKALLVESTREAVAGDVLFAEDVVSLASDIVPHAPPANLSGQIMAVVDGVSQIGQYHVVAINRGTQQGLEVGHVLAIDQKGAVVPDGSCKTFGRTSCGRSTVQLPDERAGTLLVFKTYDRMSYGLVVETTVPVRVADQVRTP
jgi:LysM repeat protein